MKQKGIDSLKVISPCSQNAIDMKTIADGVSFCSQCSKCVYDLSKFTKTQAKILYFKNYRNFCCKITRRSDGSIIFSKPNYIFSLQQLLTRLVFCISAILILFKTKIACGQTEKPEQQQNIVKHEDLTTEKSGQLNLSPQVSPFSSDLVNSESMNVKNQAFGDVRVTDNFASWLFYIEGAIGFLFMLFFSFSSGVFAYFKKVSGSKKSWILSLFFAGLFILVLLLKLLIQDFFYAEEIPYSFPAALYLMIFGIFFISGIIAAFLSRLIYIQLVQLSAEAEFLAKARKMIANICKK